MPDLFDAITSFFGSSFECPTCKNVSVYLTINCPCKEGVYSEEFSGFTMQVCLACLMVDERKREDFYNEIKNHMRDCVHMRRSIAVAKVMKEGEKDNA